MTYAIERGKIEKEAEIEFARLSEEDKNKTYLEILPEDFSTFSRSIVKRQILDAIDHATETLNASNAYNGRIFVKKEVVRYMMNSCKDDYNYELFTKFIPKLNIFDFYVEKYLQKTADDFTKIMDEVQLEKAGMITSYQDVERALSWLGQSWDTYLSREKVRKGELIHSYDMEKDGYPSTGRGCCCYLFVPIKGKFPENKTGKWLLTNPRSKKEVEYTILGYKEKDNIYKCLNEKDKEVFLMQHDDVDNAYDALFDINKEIFSGWWNRIMISK